MFLCFRNMIANFNIILCCRLHSAIFISALSHILPFFFFLQKLSSHLRVRGRKGEAVGFILSWLMNHHDALKCLFLLHFNYYYMCLTFTHLVIEGLFWSFELLLFFFVCVWNEPGYSLLLVFLPCIFGCLAVVTSIYNLSLYRQKICCIFKLNSRLT